MDNVQCTLYKVQGTMDKVQWTRYNGQGTKDEGRIQIMASLWLSIVSFTNATTIVNGYVGAASAGQRPFSLLLRQKEEK